MIYDTEGIFGLMNSKLQSRSGNFPVIWNLEFIRNIVFRKNAVEVRSSTNTTCYWGK